MAFQQQSDLPAKIPIFPLPGALLLPGGRLPLNIFEPRYLDMVTDALSTKRLIGMIQPLDPGMADAVPALYHVGCAGRLTSYQETDDDRFLITLSGISRFAVDQELEVTTRYRQVAADWTPFAIDMAGGPVPSDAARTRLCDAFKGFLDAKSMKTDWEQLEHTDASALVTFLAMVCPFSPSEKQGLLECRDAFERTDMLISLFDIGAHGTAADGEDDATPPPVH